MKKKLFIGIIFLIACLGLIIYNEVIEKDSYKINIHDITNTGSKEENVKVYLNASFIGGSIKYDNKNYYVIFGDDVQYLVLIDDKKAATINKYLLDNPEDTYHLTGVTKLIPEGIIENGIKFIKNYLDDTHEDHSHNITQDDFYHYFGHVYLDEVNNNMFVILICITGVIGVVLVFSEIINKYHLL